MSFENKIKISIIVIMLFLIINFLIFFYMLYHMSIVRDQAKELKNENISLMESNYNNIDETIGTLNQINESLNDPTLPEKVTELNKLSKYIDIDNVDEVNKVVNITKTTPLDLHTSAIIVGYTKKLDVPTSLLLGLIELESNFNQYEVGEDQDRGYCQIIPGTEKWLAETYGHKLGIKYNPKRIFEPEYNIGLGVLYLSNLRKAYGDDYHKILSEYNRGVYNLKRYYNNHGTYVTTYSRGVLRRETKYKKIEAE